MNFNKESKLLDILNLSFESGRIFAEYKISFPYYLKFTLNQICTKKNIDVEILLNSILEISNIQNPYLENMETKLIIEKILLEYHDYSRKRLAVADKYLEKTYTEYGSIYPKLKNIYEDFKEFSEEYESHLLKEEQAIFPEIEKISDLLKSNPDIEKIEKPNSIELPLENMEKQHIEQELSIEKILYEAENLYQLDSNSENIKKFLDEIKKFYLNTQYHVYIENEILFKKARRIENTFFFKVAK